MRGEIEKGVPRNSRRLSLFLLALANIGHITFVMSETQPQVQGNDISGPTSKEFVCGFYLHLFARNLIFVSRNQKYSVNPQRRRKPWTRLHLLTGPQHHLRVQFHLALWLFLTPSTVEKLNGTSILSRGSKPSMLENNLWIGVDILTGYM